MSGYRREGEPPLRLQDRYCLVECIGEGSMGAVYRAHDETLDRDVAIKFLLPERLASGEAGARFLREARAIARLSHPNIMTLYDVGQEGIWHYLVLEYIRGKDLHDLMIERGGPLPIHETLGAMRGALQALAYAHGQGIVHRDIKPENIMVTHDGQVKVTDFGLALARGDVRMTQEGTIVGTVLYLAPEVIAGRPTDGRADLYALGAVLYELLAGCPPFCGDEPTAILAQILSAPVASPRTLDSSIPAPIERVVLNLLSKDPGQRYASAQEVLSALPELTEVRALAAAQAEQATSQRTALPLLERIVRGSSTTHAVQQLPPAAEDEETLLTLPRAAEPKPPYMTPTGELLVYAAVEDTAAAVEGERRRLARLLENSAIEPLNLLLSQANAYEQSLAADPMARLAVSVLSSLARQAVQQVRDLEANLHPAVLESLGLEPALETLAGQAMRAHGLQVDLLLQRMRERLPPQVELALFRLAQDVFDRAVRHGHASRVAVRLERRGEDLVFAVCDDSLAAPDAGVESLRAARQRIEHLGGGVEMGGGHLGGFGLTVTFVADEPVDLTPREMEVIQLLAEGLSNKEIGQLLFISPRTVNFHLDNVYSKLGVSSRTEAAIYALRRGWVRRATQ